MAKNAQVILLNQRKSRIWFAASKKVPTESTMMDRPPSWAPRGACKAKAQPGQLTQT